MFLSLVQKLQARKEQLNIQAEHLEASASTEAESFSSLLVDDLNEEVRQVYETQKLLERESQLLKQELSSITQQLTTWSGKTQQLLETLKHVGDLEHYVAVLRREAAALETVLAAAAATEAEEAAEAAAAAAAAAGGGDRQTSAWTVPAETATATAARTVQEASSDLPVTPRAAAAAAAAAAPTSEAAAGQSSLDSPQDQGPSLAQLPISSRASR